LDLIFGLTEGWWKFADLELRPQYPLLSPTAWQQLLVREGFTDVTALPLPDRELPDPDQAVILARASAIPVPSTDFKFEINDHANDGAAKVWLLAGREPGLTDVLAARLARDGDTVFWLEAGNHINGTTMEGILHLIDFTGRYSEIVDKDGVKVEHLSSVWVVTRGKREIARLDEGKADVSMFFLDLDAEQSVEEQAEYLYQALRHPDDQQILSYRDGQRYVPTGRKDHTDMETRTNNGPRLDCRLILAAPLLERRKLIYEYLRQQVHSVLGLEVASVELDKPLQALGLDSLTGIQLRNRIEDDLGVSLSVVDFLKGLSMADVADRAMAALTETPQENGEGTEQSLRPLVSLTPEKVDSLPVEKLDGLLDALMN
jgi:acyl carrier protein